MEEAFKIAHAASREITSQLRVRILNVLEYHYLQQELQVESI